MIAMGRRILQIWTNPNCKTGPTRHYDSAVICQLNNLIKITSSRGGVSNEV